MFTDNSDELDKEGRYNGSSKQWIIKQEKLLPGLRVTVMLQPSKIVQQDKASKEMQILYGQMDRILEGFTQETTLRRQEIYFYHRTK